MNKRIKKKLRKRGGYLRFKNWFNPMNQMKAWAKIINKFEPTGLQTKFHLMSNGEIITSKHLPDVFWKVYDKRLTTNQGE